MCTVVKRYVLPNAMRCANGTTPATTVRGVRRKLFETEETSSSTSRKFLDRIWEEIGKESEKKWNFDFRRETPLPGRYEWMPVKSRESVPVSSCPKSGTVVVGKAASMPVVHELRPVVTVTSGKSSPNAQRKITDFMSQRKRALLSESPPVNKKQRLLDHPNETTSSSIIT